MTPLPNVRSGLPKWFVENGLMVGAEVGVFKGYYSAAICQAGVKRLYAIDPWDSYEEKPNKDDMSNVHKMALETLAPYENCTIITKTSMDAVKDFKDNSLDFVYIDGDHTFPFVAQDIYFWTRKVRKGGFVGGHDYTKRFFGDARVKPVVDAYVQAYGIKTFATIGTSNKADCIESGDKYWSWCFIKE